MLNKMSLLVAVTCLTVIALPSHAWQAARGARGGAAVRGPNGAAVRGPGGNTAARSYNRGGSYRAPGGAYGYRGGSYYSNGQAAGAAAVGLAVGAIAGAAVANSNNQPSTTVIVEQPAMAIGTNLNSLPGGCTSTSINGTQYFQCGSSWMRAYGSYYQVVPTPY